MSLNLTQILHRQSHRNFTSTPIPETTLHTILQAMQAAPNWVNTQHVSVVAIKDAQRRQLMASLCGNQRHIAEAPVFLVFCADFYRTQLAFKMHHQTFEPPTKLLDTLLVCAHEVGIALGTTVIAAEQLGLGTVPIGDVRLSPLELIRELNLPRYVIPMLGLCLGYPTDSTVLAKPRLPLEAVYFEETYKPDLTNLIQTYDNTYADYLSKRPWNSRAATWTDLVVDFYTPPYNHYPQMEEALRQQGFLSAPSNH